MTIGEKIKEIRENSGLTQKELAKKCNLAEITIRQYELNKRQPKIETLQTIAAALNTSYLNLLPQINYRADVILEAIEKTGLKDNISEQLAKALSASIDTQNQYSQSTINVLREILQGVHADLENTAKEIRRTEKMMEADLIEKFDALNLDGKEKVVDYANVLAENPRYSKEKATDPTPDK